MQHAFLFSEGTSYTQHAQTHTHTQDQKNKNLKTGRDLGHGSVGKDSLQKDKDPGPDASAHRRAQEQWSLSTMSVLGTQGWMDPRDL